MKLKVWREGANLCIENIIQLKKDGELLLENGSYGHAYFLFFTALEEIALAYFILERFDNPEPSQLKKFLRHKRKIPFAVIKAYLPYVGSEFFSDLVDIISQKEFTKVGSKKSFDSKEFKLGKKIGLKENLWVLRNRGIYLSLDESNSRFLTPKDITLDMVKPFQDILTSALANLQALRDTCFKLNKNIIMESKKKFKANTQLFEKSISFLKLLDHYMKGSIEDIKKTDNIQPELKDFFINIILPHDREFTESDMEILEKIIRFSMTDLKKLILDNINEFSLEDRYYFEKLLEYDPEYFTRFKKISEKEGDKWTIDKLLKLGLELPEIDKILKEFKEFDKELKKLKDEENEE